MRIRVLLETGLVLALLAYLGGGASNSGERPAANPNAQ